MFLLIYSCIYYIIKLTSPQQLLHNFLHVVDKKTEYIFFLFVFLIDMAQDCPIQINMMNKLDQKQSKSSPNTLNKTRNIVDNATNCNFPHVMCDL